MGWSIRVGGRRSRRLASQLNNAVRHLPVDTRRAMLGAVRAGGLIAGAYVDRSGRTCPMLAAHRQGARYDVGAFPAAWDAFVGARRPRPASPRELTILQAILEESLAGDSHEPGAVLARTSLVHETTAMAKVPA